MKILISRTDSIGGVVLTLPMAGWIKKHLPESQLGFFGKNYTRAVLKACSHIDIIENADDYTALTEKDQIQKLKSGNWDVIIHAFPHSYWAWLAKKAGIPIRIGTFGRLFHLNTVNRPVFFSRKRSDLHEAQLNFVLLKPLGIPTKLSLDEIPNHYGFKLTGCYPDQINPLIDPEKSQWILHPLSKGSAR